MTADTEFFVTAPSTPEVAAPMAPTVEPKPQADRLEIVVERRLRQQGDGHSSSMTIFRVPAHVRDTSKELYEPRLVSVGPYYRGQEALRAMEQHKWRYMRELMARRPEASLGEYVRAVRDVEQKARRCYSERTDIFDDDDAAADAAAAMGESSGGGEIDEEQTSRPGPDSFAEMLMLDGCFILEFFAKWYNREPDKLCDVGWGLPLLRSDLLLLENQVPFFVLEALFYVVCPKAKKLDLLRMILGNLKLSFYELSPAEELVQSEIHHLLHLLYKAIMPRAKVVETVPVQDQDSTPIMVVPSVSQLREAGVRFEKNPSPRHMFDIAFDKESGLLKMPRMEVDYANKALLVNLVAFEQTMFADPDQGDIRLSSYVALVGCLVRTGKDVEHLQKHGIVDNLLDCDDAAAAEFFQHLGDCSSVDYAGGKHMFAGVFEDLTQFYHSSWRRHRAKFVRDHCSSPWAVLALVVAVCAFCFALFKLSTTIYGLAHPYYCHC